MFGIFKKKPVLSKDDILFQIETFKWLMKHFGGDDFYRDTVLVLPTKEFFPSEVSHEKEAAIKTFLQVKKFAGLESWDCVLVEQDEDPDPRVGSTLLMQGIESSAAGTFSFTEETVQISYNPSLLKQPTNLVATFAHELAHYLTATSPEEPPGGWKNWEFATDLTAVFLGFGIFMANSAFTFQQFTDFDSQGWSTNRSGYLTETEFCYALAIFCALKNISVNQASIHLKPHLKRLMKRCANELEQSLVNSIIDQEYAGNGL
ncbi:MAG: hypothetical protein AAGJ37_13015 [Pseudomonadota bacterium]